MAGLAGEDSQALLVVKWRVEQTCELLELIGSPWVKMVAQVLSVRFGLINQLVFCTV